MFGWLRREVGNHTAIVDGAVSVDPHAHLVQPRGRSPASHALPQGLPCDWLPSAW